MKRRTAPSRCAGSTGPAFCHRSASVSLRRATPTAHHRKTSMGEVLVIIFTRRRSHDAMKEGSCRRACVIDSGWNPSSL